MQKLNLTQSLSQKLSPQQIQFIKLLQVPTMELAARIEQELESNPVLEEGRDEEEENLIGSEEEYDDYDENDDIMMLRLELTLKQNYFLIPLC